jgi:glycine oxidase
MKVAIVGAGICGSVLAYECLKRHFDVTVYEKSCESDAEQTAQKKACSYTAAGMLAPMAELESANLTVYQLGLRSLKLWPQIVSELEQLNHPVFYRDSGTLVLAHGQDMGSFQQFFHAIKYKLDDFDNHARIITTTDAEPELINFRQALYLKNEAQVDSHQVLHALRQVIQQQGRIKYETVAALQPKKVNDESFDWVFDCRGLGASADMKLYGVRGERILLHAPEVNIQHMIRLMHPKYRLYIVPRENHHYLIGATEIESADDGPMSVRSALELLTAAYSVHKGFAEARIVSMSTGVRPTRLDHQPIIDEQEGLTRINGLYRHGYLLTPALIEKALAESTLFNTHVRNVFNADTLAEVNS